MRVLNEAMLSKIIEFINTYQKEEGKSPSYREIQRHIKATSLSFVFRYVNELKARGLLEKEGTGSIYIDPRLTSKKTVLVPLVGVVSCGSPILAIENIEETYSLPSAIFGGEDLFMLVAKGTSMIGAGIQNGDVLVVRKQSYAEREDIVVAIVDEEATVKRYRVKNGKAVLYPENPKMKALVFEDFTVVGKVVSYIHKF